MRYALPVASVFFALGLILAGWLGGFASLLIAAAGILLTAVLVLLWRKRRGQLLVTGALALTVAFAMWAGLCYGFVTPVQRAADGQTHTVTAELTDSSHSSAGRWNCSVRILSHDLSGVPEEFSALLICEEKPTVQPYREFIASVRFYPTKASSGYWADRHYVKAYPASDSLLLQNGVSHTDTVSGKLWRVKERIRSAFLQAENRADAGVILGILLGDRSEMRQEDVADFSACGVSHVTAVSGLHTTLLAAAISFLLMLLRVSKRYRGIITCLPLLAFLALIGFPLSAVRAAIMFFIGALGTLLLRETHPVLSLSAAVILICLADPAAVTDVGFLLSVTATLGILLLGTRWHAWLTDHLPRSRILAYPVRFFGDILGMSVSAVLFTLPIMYLYFGEFSLLAPLANLAVVPLAECVVLCSALCALVSLLPGMTAAAVFLIRLPAFAARLIRGFCHALTRLPVTTVHIGYSFVGLSLALILAVFGIAVLLGGGRKKVLIATALSAAILVSATGSYALLDRGVTTLIGVDDAKGTAVVLLRGREAVVIGAGQDAYELGWVLRGKGIKTVSKLILPTLDVACAGGANELAENFSVGEIYAAPAGSCRNGLEKTAAAQGIQIRNCSENPIFAFDDTVVMCYNDRVILSVGRTRVLLTLSGYRRHDTDGAFSLALVCDSTGASEVTEGVASAAFVLGRGSGALAVQSELRRGGVTAYAADGAGDLVMRTRGNGSVTLTRQE